MPRQSAGVLVYRRVRGAVEVLLVHPGGPFWAKKDDGAWSIPKGELADDETPFDAATREFREEIGVAIDGAFVELPRVKQKGGKLVTAFAVEADVDVTALRSNTFTMEWPPRSGRSAEFPEVDRAAWFTIEQARVKILASLLPLLDSLGELLAR